MINKDFYPTPKELIDKMLSKIELWKYRNILEPSCWKWDIIDAIKSKFTYSRNPNIYWIEIEHQLRELCKDKCEIIGYDFLQFNNTMLSFDLIIANFPFSNWVNHFLKAWELLWKWELVCLVNAETIKNPFSKDRKLMNTIIKDNNWEVEFIENAFIDAERTTSVEVALVTISKKETQYDNIFKWIKEDFYNDFTSLDGAIDNNEIVKGNNKIDHIITLNKILKDQSIKNAIAKNKYDYYSNIFNKILEESDIKQVKNDELELIWDIRDSIFKINQQCWAYFFRITPLRSKLTTNTYEQFINQYQKSKIDFTRENISAVSDIIMWSAWKIQEENYIEVFDYLTRYWEENRIHPEWWKTNSWFQLNKRFITPYWVELSWDKKTIERFTYNFREKLDNIDKVFCNITWKDFNAIQKTRDWFDYEWDSEFFKIKVYKKWTVHFLVKDEYLDDLKQFNLIVCKAKKWIWF